MDASSSVDSVGPGANISAPDLIGMRERTARTEAVGSSGGRNTLSPDKKFSLTPTKAFNYAWVCQPDVHES